MIAERLTIGRTLPLMSGEMADRSWSDRFPGLEVVNLGVEHSGQQMIS